MKTFVFITFMLASIARVFIPTLNHYKETKTFYEEGYTYQCDVPKYKVVRLYNKENKFTYAKQVYRETGEQFNPPSLLGNKKLIIANPEMSQKARRIVDNAFTITEAERVKQDDLLVTMYLSPETGKVIEVDFDFSNFGPYATIPVSVYRDIEVELKKNIRFVPDEVGKQLNYIMLGWYQTPKGRKLIDKDPVLNINPIP